MYKMMNLLSSFTIILYLLLYADDMIILSVNANEFENILKAFNEYCKKWKLKINISQTKIIIFGSNGRNQHFSHKFDDEEKEIVKEF